MKGLVHIYCGDGKGKTTSATGLAIRAAGAGMNVLFVRFMKTENSGELNILRKIPCIEVVPCTKSFGFYSQMTKSQKEEAAEYYSSVLNSSTARAASGKFSLLVLDEIMVACNYHLTEESVLLDFLNSKPEGLEVVLTGRSPSDRLIQAADYISEVKKRKHPYDQGIPARKGIEY